MKIKITEPVLRLNLNKRFAGFYRGASFFYQKNNIANGFLEIGNISLVVKFYKEGGKQCKKS